MREIKFRAWDIDKKEMFYSDFIVYANGRIGWWVSEVGYEEMILVEKKVEIMQYTGLKDKNGKDIYEGDVVQEDIRRDKRSKPIMRWSVVVYSEKGMFIVECLPKSLRQWNELYKENDEVEVIGNIYENPELLNPLTR